MPAICNVNPAGPLLFQAFVEERSERKGETLRSADLGLTPARRAGAQWIRSRSAAAQYRRRARPCRLLFPVGALTACACSPAAGDTPRIEASETKRDHRQTEASGTVDVYYRTEAQAAGKGLSDVPEFAPKKSYQALGRRRSCLQVCALWLESDNDPSPPSTGETIGTIWRWSR